MKAIQRKESQSTNLNGEQKFNALIEVIENREVLLVIGRGFEVNKGCIITLYIDDKQTKRDK